MHVSCEYSSWLQWWICLKSVQNSNNFIPFKGNTYPFWSFCSQNNINRSNWSPTLNLKKKKVIIKQALLQSFNNISWKSFLWANKPTSISKLILSLLQPLYHERKIPIELHQSLIQTVSKHAPLCFSRFKPPDCLWEKYLSSLGKKIFNWEWKGSRMFRIIFEIKCH